MVNSMNKIATYLKQDKRFIRIIYFLIGVFIVSFIYNLIFVPNGIVVGGVSGLAIIIQELTGLSTTIFINCCNILLIVISFILLGKDKTIPQLLGSITYPLMVSLTEPLAKMVNLQMDSMLLSVLVASVVYGLANGIIYRAGYSTGGSDIAIQILSSKLKKPITYFSPIINNTIIVCSGIVFSPIQVMYAVTIIFISNKITNGILFGISTNKMVYVISKKSREIEDYIMNKINTGATEIRVHSGFFEKRKQMILCVVHGSQYSKFKRNILEMDPGAFILANNCYEVNGGQKYNILPF